jgi:hypothetical protein
VLPTTERTVEVFLQSGVLGAVVVVLLWAVWKLFSLYTAAQEKRIAEALEWKQSIDANTLAIKDLTDAIRSRDAAEIERRGAQGRRRS